MKQLFILLFKISISSCCLIWQDLLPKPPITVRPPTGAGCSFNREAEMFQQEENTSHPIEDWGWSFLTDYKVVDNVVGLPH